MVTYFNKKDLVSFGNYLLSDERREKFDETTKELIEQGLNPLPTDERLKSVHDADLSNWLEKGNKSTVGGWYGERFSKNMEDDAMKALSQDVK